MTGEGKKKIIQVIILNLNTKKTKKWSYTVREGERYRSILFFRATNSEHALAYFVVAPYGDRDPNHNPRHDPGPDHDPPHLHAEQTRVNGDFVKRREPVEQPVTLNDPGGLPQPKVSFFGNTKHREKVLQSTEWDGWLGEYKMSLRRRRSSSAEVPWWSYVNCSVVLPCVCWAGRVVEREGEQGGGRQKTPQKSPPPPPPPGASYPTFSIRKYSYPLT